MKKYKTIFYVYKIKNVFTLRNRCTCQFKTLYTEVR